VPDQDDFCPGKRLKKGERAGGERVILKSMSNPKDRRIECLVLVSSIHTYARAVWISGRASDFDGDGCEALVCRETQQDMKTLVGTR